MIVAILILVITYCNSELPALAIVSILGYECLVIRYAAHHTIMHPVSMSWYVCPIVVGYSLML